MSVVRACEICGKRVSMPPSRARNFRTCSHACFAVLKAGGRLPAERRCQHCGRVMLVRPSEADRPFCSRECYADSMRLGYLDSPTHNSWRSMIRRCTEPGNNRWAHYGGRGITVCDRWLYSFPAFLEDMGERPARLTLDRIDVNGNYEPGNCRWATAIEQRRNRRDSPDWDEIERILQ